MLRRRGLFPWLLAAACVGVCSALRPAGAEDAPTPPASPAPDGGTAEPARPPPERVRTADEAADEFVAALRAHADAAKSVVVERREPDGWLVAQSLLARATVAVAKDFAKMRAFTRYAERATAPDGSEVDALDRWMDSVTGVDLAAHARVAAAEAHAARGSNAEALAATGGPVPTDAVLAVRLEHVRARALHALGRDAEAATVFDAATGRAYRLGWLRRARVLAEQAGPLLEKTADLRTRAEAQHRWGRVLRETPDIDDESAARDAAAAEHFARAGAMFEALADGVRLADALEAEYEARTIGAYNVWRAVPDEFQWTQLRDVRALDRALRLRREAGDAAGELRVLRALAESFRQVGDFRRSLGLLRSARALCERLGDRAAALDVLRKTFDAGQALGERGVQADVLARVLSIAAADLPTPARLDALHEASRFHQTLEDYPAAIADERRTVELVAAAGVTNEAPYAFERIGELSLLARDFPAALAAFKQALRSHAEEAASRSLLYRAGPDSSLWTGIAVAHEGMAQWLDAVAIREAAVAAVLEQPNQAFQIGKHLLALALDYDRLGRTKRAGELLDSLAVRESPSDVMRVQTARARLHIAHGEHQPAMRSARIALATLRSGSGELAVEGRDSYRGILGNEGELAAAAIEAGTLAALGLDAPSDALYFQECGRANTLTARLAARDRVRQATVPGELAALERDLRTEMAASAAAARRAEAARAPSRDEARRRRDDIDAARETLQRVTDAIERVRTEDVERAEVIALADLQATLAAGDALVLYGLLSEDAVALVVRPGAARVIHLADTERVEAACAALDVESRDAGVAPALAALRRLLVEPLELPADVTRVLVSPDGMLAYAPYSLLFEDREVCCVPSGTAYGLLRRDLEKRGESVLALGDPDYATHADAEAVRSWRPRSGGRLARLPETGVEAKAIGDVVLVGEQASEAALRETLPRRPRWRSVHLACHGLLDAARPLFSSLALTPTAADDGFLSVVDVLHMPVAADLVVLSACETGKGTVMRGEGVLGLTRAFMIAGAPRVLVSLWKVDDGATRALMTKFYERWNPRPASSGSGTLSDPGAAPGESKGPEDSRPALSAAAALKAAQEFVRAQERWKHPYYWAAWVLWGLPD